MSIKIFSTTAALMLAFAIGVFADDEKTSPNQLAARDQALTTPDAVLNKIHAANLEEIDLAKIAATKSTNKDVTEFAATLLRDHQQADEKVRQVATAKSITLKAPMDRDPNAPAATQTQKNPEATKLQALSGKDFDREYTTAMANGHNKLLTALGKAKTQITDQQVKDLIAEIEPTVRKHAERATTLSMQLGGAPERAETQTNR